MDDSGWVASLARAHDDVVAAVSQLATTIPLRLGTTSDDDESVRALLTDLAGAATRTFDRFEGRTEYGVQVFAPRHRQAPSDGAPEGGAAFLRRRRAELKEDELRRVAAVEQAETAYQLLADVAVDDRRISVRNRTSGTAGPMVLNGAFLVDNDAVTIVSRGRRPARRLAGSRSRRHHRPVGALLLCRVGSVSEPPVARDVERASLVDLLDRVIGKGVVLSGDIVISLAGVDLVMLRLRALLTTVHDSETGPGT